MELSRSSNFNIDKTWKLCVVGSMFGFLALTLAINQIGNPFGGSSRRTASVSISTITSLSSSSSCPCPPSSTPEQLNCPSNKTSDSPNSTSFGSTNNSIIGAEMKPLGLPTSSFDNSSSHNTDIESNYSESGGTEEPSSSPVGNGKGISEDESSINRPDSSLTADEFVNPSSLPEAAAAGYVSTGHKDEDETGNLLKNKGTSTSVVDADENSCDMFDGKWVYRPEQKLPYDKTSCPFIEEKMSCIHNGRPDSDFEKWSWEPRNCNIPMFNGTDMLERLRGKRVIIVGDSLNRNQWESLACLLYTSIPSSRAHVDSQSDSYKVFRAKDYDCVVEFHWSPFIVLMDLNHPTGSKVVVLDKLPPSSQQWKGADVMVFNSGHWWTHIGKFRSWKYFEYKNELVEEIQTEVAYERALQTWSKWIDQNVNPNKTTVYFRTISSEHKRDNWCFNVTQPIMDVESSYEQLFPQSMIDVVDKRIREMDTPVRYLNVTKLSSFRIDAHPAVYRTRNWRLYTTKYRRLIYNMCDCSHWCLPGVPDTWNWLLYASLFFDSSATGSSSRL